MSRAQRIALLVASVVLAVAAFLILRPGDDDEPTRNATTTSPAPAETTGDGETTETTSQEPVPEPKPEVTRIRIHGGQPVGGEAKIEVKRDETVRLAVASDVSDEVHVHGYDLSKPVGPDQPARINFKADIEGAFEIELEESAVPIAQLEVRP